MDATDVEASGGENRVPDILERLQGALDDKYKKIEDLTAVHSAQESEIAKLRRAQDQDVLTLAEENKAIAVLKCNAENTRAALSVEAERQDHLRAEK